MNDLATPPPALDLPSLVSTFVRLLAERSADSAIPLAKRFGPPVIGRELTDPEALWCLRAIAEAFRTSPTEQAVAVAVAGFLGRLAARVAVPARMPSRRAAFPSAMLHDLAPPIVAPELDAIASLLSLLPGREGLDVEGLVEGLDVEAAARAARNAASPTGFALARDRSRNEAKRRRQGRR